MSEIIKSIERLKDAFQNSNCDKNWKHKYHVIYGERFLEVLSEKDDTLTTRLLEIGIFKGASFEAYFQYFRHYTDNFDLYGVDLFDRISPEEIQILNHPKMDWMAGDSTKVKWKDDTKFDIIIDDGLHTPLAQAKTLDNFFPSLKSGGSYFIEDVWPLNLITNEERKHKWITTHPEDYTIENYRVLQKAIEATKCRTIEHDFRKLTGQPDSFIIEIIKS